MNWKDFNFTHIVDMIRLDIRHVQRQKGIRGETERKSNWKKLNFWWVLWFFIFWELSQAPFIHCQLLVCTIIKLAVSGQRNIDCKKPTAVKQLAHSTKQKWTHLSNFCSRPKQSFKKTDFNKEIALNRIRWENWKKTAF